MPANFDTQREFTLVARAPSSANLRPNHEFVADGLSSAHGSVRATLFTRWENIGQEAPAPRELVIELVGAAPDLDAAHQAFLPIARFLGTLTAFATNVQVGFVETHLVLETTPGAVEHEMLEVFLPDERGLVREGRMVRPEHLAALGPALGHPEWPRLARAIAHYELALRDWRLGGEALAAIVHENSVGWARSGCDGRWRSAGDRCSGDRWRRVHFAVVEPFARWWGRARWAVRRR
jgi:hypothetical protein